MISENTKIKTLIDKEGHPAGSVGIVLKVLEDGYVEVEIWDQGNFPIDIVCYQAEEIEPLLLDSSCC